MRMNVVILCAFLRNLAAHLFDAELYANYSFSFLEPE